MKYFRKAKIALLKAAKSEEDLAKSNSDFGRVDAAQKYQAMAGSYLGAKTALEEIEEKLLAIAHGEYENAEDVADHFQQIAAECLLLAARY